MASVKRSSPNRWVVDLTSQSEGDSDITIELRMSQATAENLAHVGACRYSKPKYERDSEQAIDVGSAVLEILSSVVAIKRIKDRVATSNQGELMDLIDSEVDAVRARRP